MIDPQISAALTVLQDQLQAAFDRGYRKGFEDGAREGIAVAQSLEHPEPGEADRLLKAAAKLS